MTTYRKKPITVEGITWTGDNLAAELLAFCDDTDGKGAPGFFQVNPPVPGDPDAMVWDKLHSSWIGLRTGDTVMRGVKGELYPIAADVLADTYDEVTEPDPAVEAEIVDQLKRAQRTWAAIYDVVNDADKRQQLILSHMVAVTTAHLLQALQAVSPTAAAEAWEELGDLLAHPPATGEWVWEQLTERGIKPEDVTA